MSAFDALAAGRTQALQTASLHQAIESNFLFSYTADDAILFVDGQSYNVSRNFAETICHKEINRSELLQDIDENNQTILLALYNQGALILNDE